MIAWTIFRASLPLQLVALTFAAWAALGANNLYQRNIGAGRIIEKIEKKANEDAKTADAVANDALAGRGRVRNKYVRPGD